MVEGGDEDEVGAVAVVRHLARPRVDELEEARVGDGEGARPEVVARRARHRGEAVRLAHRHPQTPRVTRAGKVVGAARDLAQVVRRHELDGFRAEHASALEAAAVEEHLGEAGVVAGRGHRAAAAAVELPRHAGIMQLVLRAGVGMRGQRLRDTRALVGRDEERRVGHLQRPVDALREELAERLAGHDLDDAAEDVGRQAVLPPRAGLVEQWRLAQALDELVHGQRQRRHVRGLRVHLVDFRRPAVAVRETGGVAHQVLDRHLALDRSALHADRLGLERGNVLRHGIRQQQATFLVQRQRRHRDERLRHRGDPEDRVRRHRRARRLVTEADGLDVRDPPLARDDDDGARDPPALDVGAQHLRDAREALGGQPHLLGLRGRQIGREGEAGRQESEDQREDDRSSLHEIPPALRTSAPGAASSSHALTVMASML